MSTEIDTEQTQSLWPRRAARTSVANPMRRSRMRDASPRLRRPPKWSERMLPRRVA